jgi:RNA polymerase sigma-70 factor (ECF subfamily)
LDPAPEEAFREAAVACLDTLYGFALALSRDAAQAEDLVQETYLRALRARNKAAPGDGLRSWLFAILHNVWRNDLRRSRALAFGGDLDALPAVDGDPLRYVDRQQSGNRLRTAIQALPEPFRDVIVLRCVEGFSYREMAHIVGCPAGTIMSRLARARALLKRALGPVALPAARSGTR